MYFQDPWSFFDVAMVVIFGNLSSEALGFHCVVVWIIARCIGLAKEGNEVTTDFAFDVLSLQALFLVSLLLRIFAHQ